MDAGAAAWAAAGARSWRSPVAVSSAVATAIFVTGCDAAALALFGVAFNPAESRFLGRCAPTDAEAAGLRDASELLLLAAATQVLAATVARIAPVQPLTLFACDLRRLPMVVACHGRVHGALAVHYWIFVVMLCVALLVATAAAIVSRD